MKVSGVGVVVHGKPCDWTACVDGVNVEIEAPCADGYRSGCMAGCSLGVILECIWLSRTALSRGYESRMVVAFQPLNQ